jgi:hypothetical protein
MQQGWQGGHDPGRVAAGYPAANGAHPMAPQGVNMGAPQGVNMGAPQGVNMGGFGAPPAMQVPQLSSAAIERAGKGFVRALFDLSFRSSIGPSVIKVIYVLMLLGAAGSCFVGLAQAYDNLFDTYNGDPDWDDVFAGVVMAVVGPVVLTIAARLQCELLSAVFRIADNLQEMNDRAKR